MIKTFLLKTIPVKKGGFTLIELLVVVLIIGILSALALPQYQTAVARSRYQQMVTAAEALWKAEQLYYMANNSYTQDSAALDLSMLWTKTNTDGDWYLGNMRCVVLTEEGNQKVFCNMPGNGNIPHYTRFFSNKSRACAAYNAIARRVCANETGRSTPSADYGDYASYSY